MYSGLSKLFSLGNLQSVYSDIRNGVKMGYSLISSPVKMVGSLLSNVDNYLNQANHIPFLGNITRALQSNPMYGELMAATDDINGLMGILENAGSEADEVLSRLLKMSSSGTPQLEYNPASVNSSNSVVSAPQGPQAIS